MKYIINNKIYKITTKLDLTDQLYEATLSQDDGGPAEIKVFGYGDTRGEAIQELRDRLSEKGILEDSNNHYLPWENLDPKDRRKILVYMKGVKSELQGEWGNDEDRYRKWKELILSWTTLRYGYTTPPTFEDYKKL